MADDTLNTPPPVSTAKNRPKTKYAAYYVADSFKVNEFLTIPEALEAVNIRILSLLTSDVKTRKLIEVNRENMEDALKTLHISSKVLARRTNTL